jgi:hypothetical protein
MARDLTLWVVAVLLVVAAVVLVDSTSKVRFTGPRFNQPEPTAARRRAMAISSQWRMAVLAERVVGYREGLKPRLQELASTGRPTVALLMDADDTLRTELTPILAPALDSAWRALGLGVTKVSVGVTVSMRGLPALPGTGPISQLESEDLFLLPDSLAPSQCLSVTAANRMWVTRLAARGALVRWLGSSLGPCAFYARFGVPSARVRSWLGARGYDLALAPMAYGQEAGFSTTWMFFGTPWEFLYGLPPVALGCVAGRAANCATTIRSGDGAPSDAVGGLLLAEQPWRLEGKRMADGQRFLAEVLEAVGPERFAEFWITDLPVDSALTLALRRPVGEWAAEWQQRIVPGMRLGPTLPLRPLLTGLVTLLIAPVPALWLAGRRQVG